MEKVSYSKMMVSHETQKKFRCYFKKIGLVNTTPIDELHLSILFSSSEIDGYVPLNEKIIIKPKALKLTMMGKRNDLVLLIRDKKIIKQYKKIINKGGNQIHPDYSPHITLSYNFLQIADFASFPAPDFNVVLEEEKTDKLNINWLLDKEII